MKVCVHCLRRLSNENLLVRESLGMEEARASLGLHGVRFRYYSCSRCGHDSVFLEIVRLPGDTHQDLRARKDAMNQAAREFRAPHTTVLVVEEPEEQPAPAAGL
jgi:hypothetical protein